MEVTHTQDPDELVTVSEAARIAFLSVDTIRRYADKGVLAVVRTPSNHRRFRRADVEALLKAQASA
ncbi:helix-turn-helix domain-containing protein [Microbacterium sp. UBA837]|uniref:helix-turn-helix domain-containing protein n=1 Tax=Microbacterium sp. UBA837 TaxID=1946956 RepID=UPI0025CED33E|nr:helix-turn-helix domain-containing protein [Microbacterium sp. UBA837]|tara:strand:+ start:520 stop:717 length:198 start_codon:yes stop_codon:yes gene_type:complete